MEHKIFNREKTRNLVEWRLKDGDCVPEVEGNQSRLKLYDRDRHTEGCHPMLLAIAP